MKVSPETKQILVDAIKREMDAQYEVMRQTINLHMAGIEGVPIKITWRHRVRWAWNDFTWRIAAGLVWLARKVNAGAVPNDEH